MSENWPLEPREFLEQLNLQGISYELHEHAPVFTVQDGLQIERNIEGAHCRNLFLRDKNKTVFLLVSLRNSTSLDLKKLSDALGVKRLSFGSPELLWEKLGVKPGSVCPYAILNNRDVTVRLILEAGMFEEDKVNFHPLINSMTIGVKPDDLYKIVTQNGRKAEMLDMSGLAPDITAGSAE